MKENTKIKIIKKGAVKPAKPAEKVEKKSKHEAAREMVSTVSTWVNDFQQRKRLETKQAFENLFNPSPKASEV